MSGNSEYLRCRVISTTHLSAEDNALLDEITTREVGNGEWVHYIGDRDLEIAGFTPKPWWKVRAQLEKDGVRFEAEWVAAEQYCDDEKRCVNQQIAQAVQQLCLKSGNGSVISVEKKRAKTPAPLCFSLGDLQEACNRKWGLGANEVLSIAQSLYETHKATTYPRTDCGYLPVSMREEVNDVLQAVQHSDPAIGGELSRLDTAFTSRVWNDKKITAHHAIIPTRQPFDIAKLNAKELKVYTLIRLHYLAQFMPLQESDVTDATFNIGNQLFRTRGRVMVHAGWKSLFRGELAEEEEGDKESAAQLPVLEQGNVCSVTAGGFAVLSAMRARQGIQVIRYRRNLRRLPRYVMTSKQIPVSKRRLFLGRGFRWTQKHTQRLRDTLRPEVAHYLKPSKLYQLARQLEEATENSLPAIGRLLSADTPVNPVRPLPPVGGNPVVHGIEPDETDVTLDLRERVGHTVVYGTTRVGKTRLAELLITQDIRRGDVTIVFDPKGDADLLKRVWAEAHRAGRGDQLTVFHLGWPDISARYNAVGRFGRVSEVATRVAGQLSGEGNSAAFREFAWRFVNIVARALVALGERPDYTLITRYVNNIAELYLRYADKIITEKLPELNSQIENNANAFGEDDVPRNMQGQPEAIRIWAVEVALSSDAGNALYDPILDGLRSAVRYDRTYFDKIVASLLPLLEKLTTGKTAELLSPDYLNMEDPRPIFDWEQVIRKKGIVYVGLDALSDSEVASAVGNSMFADLVSVAGHIYKHGINGGLPGSKEGKDPINLHCDEFNELMGNEFIPLINKGGGAGMQVTAYTQTSSDIEARIGSAAKTSQVQGNFNNLIMLRVRENRTAELLTSQLPQVEIYSKTLVSGHQDSADVTVNHDFTSSTQDRVGTIKVPLLEPADIVTLPKGQAFALLEGGQLWKIRMPLPAGDAGDVHMPENIARLAEEMRRNYHSSEGWWDSRSSAAAPVKGDNNG